MKGVKFGVKELLSPQKGEVVLRRDAGYWMLDAG
jgi:hypothetical protein